MSLRRTSSTSWERMSVRTKSISTSLRSCWLGTGPPCLRVAKREMERSVRAPRFVRYRTNWRGPTPRVAATAGIVRHRGGYVSGRQQPGESPRMSVSDRRPDTNWLLAALPDADRERLLQRGERVSLSHDQRVMHAQEPSPAIWFPLTAVVSIVQTTTDHAIREIATVGRDGMVPLESFLATQASSSWDAFCQLPGDTFRVPARTLGTIVTGTTGVRDIVGRYSQAFVDQIGRNSACNQLHSMLQRCSRWILLVRRQCGRDDFPLTQQSLATMLGVRRATVTEAARDLQMAGAISYRHGAMQVTDVEALLERSCECYAGIVERYEQLLRN
ncbi:MAG: helix-turn-helix domain-containing protein [Nitriliruptorales bacterium]|nr:helix-turn-helix domain-containing protein [Nitriliruptorales bacterium]